MYHNTAYNFYQQTAVYIYVPSENTTAFPVKPEQPQARGS